MTAIGVRAAFLALTLAACGGAEPEPEYRWEEEETVYEERRPTPPPPPPPPARTRDHDEIDRYENRPSRGGAESGDYGGPRRNRGAEGAIYPVKRGVFCDESVRACYTAKGGHPGVTEQQFGADASRRLSRRIEEEGKRGARAIVRAGDGVVCDRLSEVCYDREGANLTETRREFGHGAAEELSERVDRPQSRPGHRGGVIFSPRRGVSCDEQVAACYVGDAAHAGHTKEQFGVDAARALERRTDGGKKQRDGIYRPGGGAVCDRLAEVCYDKNGANANVTREEFGREAAVRLAERLE